VLNEISLEIKGWLSQPFFVMLTTRKSDAGQKPGAKHFLKKTRAGE
jgi:hypothetical protein